MVDMQQLEMLLSEETTRTIRALTENNGPSMNAVGHTKAKIMEIQRTLVKNPQLSFEDGSDPMVADAWIGNIEHHFYNMKVDDTFVKARVAPTTFQKDVVA